MEWFDEFSSRQRMLSFAEREDETNTGTWGMGAPGSPHRLRLIEDLKPVCRIRLARSCPAVTSL